MFADSNVTYDSEQLPRGSERVLFVISNMTMPNLTGDKSAVELMKIRSDIPVVIVRATLKNVFQSDY